MGTDTVLLFSFWAIPEELEGLSNGLISAEFDPKGVRKQKLQSTSPYTQL